MKLPTVPFVLAWQAKQHGVEVGMVGVPSLNICTRSPSSRRVSHKTLVQYFRMVVEIRLVHFRGDLRFCSRGFH